MGKISSAGTGPYIIVQDPCDPLYSSTFYVNQRVLKTLGVDLLELSEFSGKLVQFMALFWYRYGSSKFTPPYPEIISLKFVKDSSVLVRDDLIGFVRVRGKISLKLVGDRYPELDLYSVPKPLMLSDDEIIYDFHSSIEDKIGQVFIEQEAAIRSLRDNFFSEISNQGKPHFILPELILNEKRLELKGIAEWIFYNKPLFNCLLALTMKRDIIGELPCTYKEFIAAYPKFSAFFSADSFLWLRNIDLLSVRKGKPIHITKMGADVAYLALEDLIVGSLKKLFEQKGVVDFVGLEKKIPAPPSILLKALRELEAKKAASPSVVHTSKCELFWIQYAQKTEGNIDNEITNKVEILEKQVLDILNSVHHSLQTVAVLERTRAKGLFLSYPALAMVLSRLSNQKRVQEKEPGFWFYPLKARVIDVLKEKPSEALTPEEIAISISLAPMHTHLLEVDNILKELRGDGAIEEVLKGHWSTSLSVNNDRRRQILKNACRKKVLVLLEKTSMKEEELLHEIVSFASSITKGIRTTTTSPQIAFEVLNTMLAAGEITRQFNLIKLRKPS